MSDRFLGSCRELPFDGVTPSADALRAMSVLGLDAVCEKVDGFKAALAAALWHDSYLYEHQRDAPNLTRGVLRALETLGGSWLSRELAVTVVQARHDDRPGAISSTVAGSRVAFAQHVAANEDWVRACGQFGGSLADRKPARVLNTVYHQVAGLLCIVGAEEDLRRHLANALLCSISEAGAGTDWMTLLDQVATADRNAIRWTFDAAGPNHGQTFLATCSSGARSVSASGTSKKAARLHAAERMIREHFPHVLNAAPSRAPAPRPALSVPRTQHAEFLGVVDSLPRMFGLSESSKPQLAQAFVHASWAYENRSEMTRARQRDNGVLGFVGSQILNYEVSLAETLEVIRNALADYAHLTSERRTDVEAMRLLGLDGAILLGRGQRLHGLPDEIVSSAFQALAAAVHMALGHPRSLLEHWPDAYPWTAVADLIAPGVGRPRDAITRVQEFAAASGLVSAYSFDRAGPDHNVQYTAQLVLESAVLRRRLKVTGKPCPSKTAAKHDASELAVRWIDALNHGEALDRIAGRSASDLAGAIFLLSHLCESAALQPKVSTSWRRFGLLGSATQDTALTSWAAAADRILTRQKKVQLDVEGLTAYFRDVANAADSALVLSSPLNSILDWIAGLDPQEGIGEHQERRLVALAAAYRALGSDQQEVSLTETLEGQILLSRGRLRIDLPANIGKVPALIIAAIEALLAVMNADRRTALIQLDETGELIMSPKPVTGDPPPLEDIVALWSSLGIEMQLNSSTGRVSVHIGARQQESHGPIETALMAASTPQPSALAAAMADLLHDVKNQVAAAKALATTLNTGSRTSRLEKQLAVSRHVDQAAALGERIRAASDLLGPSAAPGEATPLADFLRRYASAMIVGLPASVSLSIGAAGDEMHVAMSEPALIAVLDNLIKNAVEAMHDGGHVTLEWACDQKFAVVEVTDDGPGLPESVREALESGGRIRSTKAGGNGLGLLGVRSMLRGIGGDFEPARVDSGTTWHLTIPIAEVAKA
ncbi:MAG TPA: ATP-binding protein [Flexivirga sp.]|uniref:ATP-binding protein n=1 Tax=Flexivirga sp. TaxID=1962927 RepID=UPI002B650BC4|nr:ATP-binding protein [Flexivirga sp.]HWC22740.1 ATP-binding protein [Flexivirga sp.]